MELEPETRTPCVVNRRLHFPFGPAVDFAMSTHIVLAGMIAPVPDVSLIDGHFRVPHDFAPARELRVEEAAELLGRAAHRFRAFAGKTVVHLARVDDSDERRV